jgi:serine/threonine protein kinase
MQRERPILKDNLHLCDNWSFGVLVLETLLQGKLYSDIKEFRSLYGKDDGAPDSTRFLQIALKSIGGTDNDVQFGFFKAMLRRLLQVDPQTRLSNLSSLGIFSKWRKYETEWLSCRLC